MKQDEMKKITQFMKVLLKNSSGCVPQPFEVVDKNQHQNVIPGILLLDRRRQQMVLGIVVDHRLSENLVTFITSGRGQLSVHKSSNLIHI